MVNGFDSLILTKLDVLDELDEIPVCVAYKIGKLQTEEMPATNREVEEIEPVYEMLPGWKKQTRGISRFRICCAGSLWPWAGWLSFVFIAYISLWGGYFRRNWNSPRNTGSSRTARMKKCATRSTPSSFCFFSPCFRW